MSFPTSHDTNVTNQRSAWGPGNGLGRYNNAVVLSRLQLYFWAWTSTCPANHFVSSRLLSPPTGGRQTQLWQVHKPFLYQASS